MILCGGSGTRLWPLTRQALPKQFLPLTSDRPLIVETAERLRRHAPNERIWLVGGRIHERAMRDLLPELPPENVIVEPVARNSTGAVGLAMARILRHDPEAVFTAFHSDHVVRNLEQFDAAVRLAARIAEGGPIVNVGAPPSYPETGYGYVERGRRVAAADGVVAFEVARFVEKPDAATAADYVSSGRFLWNVGLFTWRADRVRALLQEHLPGTVELLEATERVLESDPDAALATFSNLPNIAVDYAILEKATDRVVIEAEMGWIDIGDWAAMYATSPKDAADNALDSTSVAVDARGLYVSTTRVGKIVAAIGVEDLIVVDTDDALLIVPRGRTQDVRRVVDELKRRGLERYL